MQANCIFVKTAPEMYIKSDFVNKQMTALLISNIQKSFRFHGIQNAKLKPAKGRIEIRGSCLEKMVAPLKTIFGINSFSFAAFFPTTELAIIVQKTVECAQKTMQKGDSFKVDCKRSGNQGYSSKTVEEQAGQKILEKISGIRVNLEKPTKTVFVNVQPTGCYVYNSVDRGLNGLPVGSQGEIGFLMQNQKKEANAIWLLLKRGCSVIPILAKKEYPLLLKKMEKWNSFQPFEIISQKELENAVQKNKILALANADSVLSKKELTRMVREDEIFSLPVLRPLLGFPLNQITVAL
ncbi:hypothetical protein KKE06_05150 [Candidatus Micrarchaeota archaeon]|nr:hypothetical protein [Candidatus Micrarchaeota archaeon]MBU1929896.1 hypothetical protein [Candidatus Micrarchaeota archaeon]